MPTRDGVRLRHMLDAAREAVAFAEGRCRRDLDEDRMLANAVVRSIEVVGEAASGIREETRNLFSEIPWADIVGMRNRLIHAYFDVDMNRVWDTINDDLPPLITQIEAAVQGYETDGEPLDDETDTGK